MALTTIHADKFQIFIFIQGLLPISKWHIQLTGGASPPLWSQNTSNSKSKVEFLALSSNHILHPAFPCLGDYYCNLVNQSMSAHEPLYSFFLEGSHPISWRLYKLNFSPIHFYPTSLYLLHSGPHHVSSKLF